VEEMLLKGQEGQFFFSFKTVSDYWFAPAAGTFNKGTINTTIARISQFFRQYFSAEKSDESMTRGILYFSLPQEPPSQQSQYPVDAHDRHPLPH